MAEALSSLSLALIAVFAVSIAVTLYLVTYFQRKARKDVADLSARTAELERSYLRLKPELEELKAAIDDRVDYGTMEKKLKELIGYVGEKMRGKKQ